MRRVVVCLLMLAVMLPSAAFARTEYLCSMDRQVRSACCCPANASKTKRETAPVSAITAACCCEVSTVKPTKTSAIDSPSQVSTRAQPPSVAIAVAPAMPTGKVVVTSVTQRALAPPILDRSLFVRHCALLL